MDGSNKKGKENHQIGLRDFIYESGAIILQSRAEEKAACSQQAWPVGGTFSSFSWG